MQFNRFNQWVITHPFTVIGLCLLVVALFSYAIPKMTITTDFEVFFPEHDENLVAYHELQDTYTNVDNVMFVVAPKDKRIFTQSTLSILAELTESAWQLPYSQRVDSIINYQHTIAEEDDLLVDNLIIEPELLTSEHIHRAKSVAITEPQLVNRLISKQADVAAVNVIVNFHQNNNRGDGIGKVVIAARALLTEFQNRYPEADFYLVGRVMNNNAFKEASIYDMSHIVPLALVVALLCIAAFLFYISGSLITSITGTLATLMVIVTSTLFAMGTMVWMNISLSPPVANAPTMILTLAIADSMHILSSYFQYIKNGMNKPDAIQASLNLNHQPVFLTSLTTIVGFLSLNFNESPPFRDLGNVVAVGVFAAWIFSITLLPALVIRLPFSVHQNKKTGNDNQRLADFVIAHHRALLITGVSLVFISGYFIFNNRLNDVWAEYFHESTEIRVHSDFVRNNLASSNSISFSLNSGEEGGISEPAFQALSEKFALWLSNQPEVTHVVTYTDIMKRLNKNMHGDDDSWYKIPQNRELAAQYLLLFELSLPFGLDLNNQLSTDKSSTRLTATVSNSSTDAILNLQKRSQQWLQDNTPAHMHYPGTSADIMFAHMGYKNIRSMLEGAFFALLIISIILGIALRSVKYGLISLVPNFIPAVVGFGVWGLLIGQIGLGLSAVAGMTLGIIVDYTVHFLSKYLRAKREQQLSEEDAIRYAFKTVGTALVVTTVVLTANFGVLAFSNFRLSSDMGLLTAGTIIVALLTDFFLLPPLLLLIGQKENPPTIPSIRKTDTMQSKIL